MSFLDMFKPTPPRERTEREREIDSCHNTRQGAGWAIDYERTNLASLEADYRNVARVAAEMPDCHPIHGIVKVQRAAVRKSRERLANEYTRKIIAEARIQELTAPRPAALTDDQRSYAKARIDELLGKAGDA